MKPLAFTAVLAITNALGAQSASFHKLTIPTGPSPRWIAVAEVNHDNHPAVIAANAGSGQHRRLVP
jgi:hypothetical protein